MAPKGSAAYKKRDGTLQVAKDSKSISWTPTAPPGSAAELTIAVTRITNLQQTPASSAKVMLKIFAQAQDGSAPETYIFSFTSPNVARAEADAIKEALSSAISAAKSPGQANGVPPASGGGGGGSSAAMAIAQAVSSGTAQTKDLYDDEKLLSNVELQSSLLKSDPSLQRTFMELLRTKPSSISNMQFTTQFWSTRTRLLRAHAIEKAQSKGAYNVLSSLKPTTEANVTRMNISKEQIQLIFSQHPLVKRVYDENVPKLNEATFWSRFFVSRLFKKLKGERIVENDSLDPVLDKYLRYDDEDTRNERTGAHVPHIIDIEGNEENHSQRQGNQPDLTMRPSGSDRVPIMRVLNNLSERIMAQVAPADNDPSAPIGMDEETYNELALRDLQGDAEENRIILNIKDQQRFFSDTKEIQSSKKAMAKQSPDKVISRLRDDLSQSQGSSGFVDLQHAVVADEESEDEDDEKPRQQNMQVGSKASFHSATKQILGAVAQSRSQSSDLNASGSFSEVQRAPADLSAAISDRLTLTHATTTEFLHHFWLVFLSGDAERAGELGQLAESLSRAMERIEAVANDAEEARNREVEQKKSELRAIYQSTGKKLKFNPSTIGGGAKVVLGTMGPTIKALGYATSEYKKALKAEGIDEKQPT